MADRLHILVIDDSEDDRLLYRRSLQKSADTAYIVSEATDGETGLQQVAEKEPVCVLLDYSMPGHDGIEVLRRIRLKHPFVPVVMLTGHGNEAVAVNAMQEGAQNYIAKASITPQALQRVIATAIEHCAMQKRIHDQRTSLEIFTRALAHDLKEPMRTIRSFLDLVMQRETFSGKTREYFGHIQQASDRMIMLIDTVYFYTRLDGSESYPGTGMCQVASVLEDVKKNIATLMRERSAVITSEPLPEIYFNRPQLMQVLQNLLVNAIRYSGPTPEINVSAKEEENRWQLRISDNGPGIDPEYFDKIFEPFKRLTDGEDGAGLGLAICKKIVESHGGKIWCESASGAGATFVFTLPKAMPATSSATEKTSAAAPEKSATDEDCVLATMLLVDDRASDIELTRIMLQEEAHLKCNFMVAHDGFQALSMLRNAPKTNPIDMILLDINMPGMDGFELLEQLRKENMLPNVTVIMCTNSIYDKDMQRAKSLGALAYLNKPPRFQLLRPALEQAGNVRLIKEEDSYTLCRAG